MEVIPSFQVDHSGLMPGIYISRQDGMDGGEGTVITTFDIRMTAPNREPAINVAAIHTIEHLAATYLRNREGWKERVIYWGPMGCLTGNYFIVRGKATCEEVRRLMIETMDFIINFNDEVPGTTPDACGNCLMHDLPMAKWEARRYKERLENDFHSEYKLLEREDVDGMMFHDA